MKYIDAEKLKAEVKRYKNKADERLKIKGRTFSEEQKDLALQNLCGNLLYFISSLQQEQPDCHTVEDWIQHIKNADQLAKDIFSKGPYDVLYDALNHPYQHCYDAIKEFGELCFQTGVNSVKQEQPEVDLEKFAEKIKTFQGRYKHPEIVSIKGATAFMARMFYQYPNVARQWYEQLPKATIDNATKEESK